MALAVSETVGSSTLLQQATHTLHNLLLTCPQAEQALLRKRVAELEVATARAHAAQVQAQAQLMQAQAQVLASQAAASTGPQRLSSPSVLGPGGSGGMAGAERGGGPLGRIGALGGSSGGSGRHSLLAVAAATAAGIAGASSSGGASSGQSSHAPSRAGSGLAGPCMGSPQHAVTAAVGSAVPGGSAADTAAGTGQAGEAGTCGAGAAAVIPLSSLAHLSLRLRCTGGEDGCGSSRSSEAGTELTFAPTQGRSSAGGEHMGSGSLSLSLCASGPLSPGGASSAAHGLGSSSIGTPCMHGSLSMRRKRHSEGVTEEEGTLEEEGSTGRSPGQQVSALTEGAGSNSSAASAPVLDGSNSPAGVLKKHLKRTLPAGLRSKLGNTGPGGMRQAQGQEEGTSLGRELLGSLGDRVLEEEAWPEGSCSTRSKGSRTQSGRQPTPVCCAMQ